MDCYLALDRPWTRPKYPRAPYLTLSRSLLRGHSLALEIGRRGQTWLKTGWPHTIDTRGNQNLLAAAAAAAALCKVQKNKEAFLT